MARPTPPSGPETKARNMPENRYIHAMPNVADVIENALALPLVDRSYIASKLIESLENEELSSEALAEYDRRVARWKAGEIPSSGRQELDARVRAILNP